MNGEYYTNPNLKSANKTKPEQNKTKRWVLLCPLPVLVTSI